MRTHSIEAVAKALAYAKPEQPVRLHGLSASEQERAREQYRTALAQWARDVRAVARAAASDCRPPRAGHGSSGVFQYEKFYRACGLNEVTNHESD